MNEPEIALVFTSDPKGGSALSRWNPPEGMRMRAAIYARLSHDPNGTSTATERQEADARQLCAERDWEVRQVFIDNDVSAYDRTKKRPGFEALLCSLAAGEFDTVVVWKTDRLARRGRDLQRFLDACEPSGATLTSCTEPEFAGPTGLLMLRLVNSFAEHESSVKSERVARANRERAQQGKPHGGGGRKFGYTSNFRPHPIEAPLVKEAAERLLAGQSGRAIARDWKDRGITPVAGGMWTQSNFKRMMRAPIYAGLRAYHGELLAGTWPALIERSQWDMLRVVLEPRASHQKAITRHLLSGLARCGAPGCGARMFGVFHHGHVEYRCNQERGCGRVSIRSTNIEPEVLRHLFAEAPRLAKKERQAHHHLAAKLVLLDTITGALDDLHTARFVDQVIDQQAFLRAKSKLDARLESQRAEIAKNSKAAALSGDLETEWVRHGLEWRRQVLESTVKRIIVHPGRRAERVEIEWLD